MLTPEQLLDYSQSNKLTDLLDQLEADTLEELARLLAASAKYFTDDEKNMSIRNNFLGSIEWQNWVATSISTNRTEMYRKIDAINKKTPGYTEQLFKDAGIKSWDESDFPRFMQGYEAGLLTQKPVKFADNPILQGIIEAGIERTNGELQNFTRTTARKTDGVLQDVLSQAHFQYVTSAFSREAAINNAMNRLTQDRKNLPALMRMVEYPSGHKDYLEVVVRRAVIGGLNLTTAQMNKDQGDRLGGTTVETTAHLFPRDTGVGYENHLGWQGRWFSWQGRNPNYPSFEEECGFEHPSGRGILGYNCRHTYAFVFPGISEPAYNPDDYIVPDIEYRGEKISAYEMTQRQRRRERSIVALKRQLVAHNAAMQSSEGELLQSQQNEFQAVSVRLKKAEARLRDFCKETGLEYQPNRVQYFGYDRSLASKTSAANRRYLRDKG